MATIYLRNIGDDIKVSLEKAAQKHGLSLNKYVCNILTDYANNPEVKSVEDKYANLAKDMVGLYEQILNRTVEALNANTYVLRQLTEKED